MIYVQQAYAMHKSVSKWIIYMYIMISTQKLHVNVHNTGHGQV